MNDLQADRRIVLLIHRQQPETTLIKDQVKIKTDILVLSYISRSSDGRRKSHD